jgi:hypothetical protein
LVLAAQLGAGEVVEADAGLGGFKDEAAAEGTHGKKLGKIYREVKSRGCNGIIT